jgi:hypothetical protein
MRDRLASWIGAHPNAAVRLVAVPTATALLWRAVAIEGSPEGAVLLGSAAVVFAMLAAAISIEPVRRADRVSDSWRQRHDDEQRAEQSR